MKESLSIDKKATLACDWSTDRYLNDLFSLPLAICVSYFSKYRKVKIELYTFCYFATINKINDNYRKVVGSDSDKWYNIKAKSQFEFIKSF